MVFNGGEIDKLTPIMTVYDTEFTMLLIDECCTVTINIMQNIAQLNVKSHEFLQHSQFVK